MSDLLPLVVGANHRSSSMMLRDRLFVDAAIAPDFLRRLQGAGLDQSMVVSTCDRVEILCLHKDADRAAAIALEHLALGAGLTAKSLDGQTYILKGKAAARHLFAVASSLDSLIVGEPQVLGQIKDAHRLALDAGTTGPELESLMQAAFVAAKRVRSETGIGEGPVSLAAAAVQLARDVHGDLDRSTGLLVGDGDMGEMVARDLLSAGISRMIVTHPVTTRVQALADGLNCHGDDFARLPELLAGADVVLTALGGRQHFINEAMIETALKKRRQKPMFLVDTGIPGDVEPAVGRIDGAFLYDLNDLERLAMAGRASREAHARQAWRIVDEELEAFGRSRAERGAAPMVTILRGHFENLGKKALLDAGGDGEKAVRLLIKRILHDPSEALRQAAASGADLEIMEKTIRRLFRMEDKH